MDLLSLDTEILTMMNYRSSGQVCLLMENFTMHHLAVLHLKEMDIHSPRCRMGDQQMPVSAQRSIKRAKSSMSTQRRLRQMSQDGRYTQDSQTKREDAKDKGRSGTMMETNTMEDGMMITRLKEQSVNFSMISLTLSSITGMMKMKM